MKKRHSGLIVFDLDGTLIDSLDDIADAANKALSQANMPQHLTAAYRYFVGDGLPALIQRIVPAHTSEQDQKQVAALFKTLYQQNWNRKTDLYPGIRTLIDWLDKSGVRLSILSNKPDSFTRLCVKEFFPDQPFELVFGQRQNVPLKPHPQAALGIIRTMGVSPQSSLFVGDTAVDMKTGKAAGMKSVGVTWGFRQEDELLKAGADIIISKPEELKRYVH